MRNSDSNSGLEFSWPLWIGFFACALGFSFLSIMKYRAFNMGLDFGNMFQSMASTLDGRLLEMTRTDTGENVNRLFGHIEGIYLLLLPVFALIPRAETLLVLQSLALASGGLAVFWNARLSGLERGPSLALAYAYWCFPYLANVAMADFHSDAFMIFPHLMAWYCLKRGSKVGFWAFILLGAACKEYTSLFNFMLALVVFREHRKVAVGLVALALAQFFLITPGINLWAIHGHYQLQLQEHAVPGSIAGIASEFAEKAFTREYFWNTLSLLLLFNVAWFRYPKGLILVVPIYVGLTISNQWGIFANHRHAMLIAPLFITLVEGISRIRPAWQPRLALWGACAPAIALMLFYPGSLFARNRAEMSDKSRYRNEFHYHYTRHDRIADSLLTLIPAQAPVASDLELRSKLANRHFAFAHPFPVDIASADYYLFDFFESLGPENPAPRLHRCALLMQSGKFFPKAYLDGLLMLERNARDSIPPFFLRRIGSREKTDSAFQVTHSEVLPWPNGFLLHTRFTVGSAPAHAQALISFFISPQADTIRVLHLPSFTIADLDSLTPGAYEEEFFFQAPVGTSLQGRRHSMALFHKDPYLSLFSRREFLVKRL